MLKRGAGGDAMLPKFGILNPALTQTLPAYQTACGIADIIAHLYERYLTNTPEVEVTDRLIEALMLTMIHEGPRVIADPDNYDAREYHVGRHDGSQQFLRRRTFARLEQSPDRARIIRTL